MKETCRRGHPKTEDHGYQGPKQWVCRSCKKLRDKLKPPKRYERRDGAPCLHPGCEKYVINKFSLCSDHRKVKCKMRKCAKMIEPGKRFCSEHTYARASDGVEA